MLQEIAKMIIQVENLWRVYQVGMNEIQALRGVNLQVGSGKFVALKGKSGSGKTTLLNCLCGLDIATKGSIRIFGQEIDELSDEERTRWRREKVGLIFQSFGLMPTLSAYENIELMGRLVGKDHHERHERTIAMLRMVGLERWMNHRPYELSGGQQQRVAIARALLNHPLLILADEPTGELDSVTAREILELFRQITKDEGVTILMASHDPMVDSQVDEVIHLRDGLIEK